MKKLFFLLACTCLSGVYAQNYVVSTAVGNNILGNVNGPALSCELYNPYGMKSDQDSILYFADVQNHTIKKLNYNTHIVSKVAGTGSAGHLDGAGNVAQFNAPVNVFYISGFLYVVEASNWIRKIDLNNNNTVSTVAGCGAAGFQNGAALSAKFNNPTSVYVEPNGDIYICDYQNQCIRLLSGGVVTTYAGVPTSAGLVNGSYATAKFNKPREIYKDVHGDFYVCDLLNNCIRKMSGGQVTTFSGTGVQGNQDGAANVATFYHPTGMCMTNKNYFYITDGGNNKIRKIDSLGNVSTVAGTGAFGYVDGAGSIAQFNRVEGLCYDAHGAIYIGDADNNLVRKLAAPEVDCAPDVTISGITNICSGNNTVLTAGGAATSYTWSANAGGVTTASVNVSPPVSTTYIVYSTGSNGCVATDSVKVYVASLPVIAVSSQTICVNDTATLTATGANTYTWNPAPAFSNGSGSSVMDSPAQTTTYTVTGTGGNGCVNNTMATLTVDSCFMQVANIQDHHSFEIFPNPGSTEAFIKASSYAGSRFVMLDEMGREVRKGKLTAIETRLDIAELSRGIYFILVFDDKQRISRKFVKQ